MMRRLPLLTLICGITITSACSREQSTSRTDTRDFTEREGTSAMNEDGLPTRGLKCHVTMNLVHSEVIDFTISNGSLVQQLVVEPLQSATIDENPAKYIVLGYLTVETDGKESDKVILFSPLGQIKRKDTYLIADFAALGEYLTAMCNLLTSQFQVSVPKNTVSTDGRGGD